VDEINQQVAERLHSLRKKAGMSLEDLARRSGVSRAMLSQIETLKANPTIAVLWKIAAGLGVPFSDLLGTQPSRPVRIARAADARLLYSADHRFSSRPLLANVPGHKVELYELHLDPGGVESAEPHPPDTYEHLFVVAGSIGLELGADRYDLSPRDAILFRADVAHTYRTLGSRPFRGLSLILYGS